MKHLVQEAGLSDQIICDSAGTSNYHIGEAPDSRMIMMARQRGIHLDSQARQLHPDDLEKFDLILAMDKENLREIRRLDHQQPGVVGLRVLGRGDGHHGHVHVSG